jgi:hypothetical protein
LIIGFPNRIIIPIYLNSGNYKEEIMKKFVSGVISFMLLSGAAFADYKSDLEAGLNAYRSGDYQKAYRHLTDAYAEKPSVNLGKYLTLATEKYKESMDSLLDDAGVDDGYGGWSTLENIIAMNPCYIAYGTIALYYERKITSILSIGIGGGYSPTGGSFGGSIVNSSGHTVGFVINMFPEGRALNGWFVGPEFNYFDFKYEYAGSYYYPEGEKVQQYFVTYGMHGGYRWILSSGFIVDLSVSIIMKTGKSISNIPDTGYFPYEEYSTDYMNYFMPSLGCNVGFAF